jgi:hypothetical protein
MKRGAELVCSNLLSMWNVRMAWLREEVSLHLVLPTVRFLLPGRIAIRGKEKRKKQLLRDECQAKTGVVFGKLFQD